MISILGTGHYLPPNIMTNQDLAAMVDTTDEWIVTRTGIRSRHIVTDETAFELSLRAARSALDMAGVSPGELGLIICATITADNLTPSLACQIAGALDVRCAAFDLNAACSGFVYALKTAAALYDGRPALIIGCELLSRVANFSDRATCVLFGDGAGAAVLGERGSGGILRADLSCIPDTSLKLLVPGINRGEGGCSYLQMDGQEVYKFATRMLPPAVRNTLDALGLTVEDIDHFIPHQANIRIIKTAMERLDIPAHKCVVTIDHTANTSSASCAIALDELARSGRLSRGQLIVMAAFGGGMTMGVAAIRW